MSIKNIKKIFSFIILILICLVIFGFSMKPVFAQLFKPQIGIGNFTAGTEINVAPSTFTNYLVSFYNWSIRAIAILSVIMIMIAGFKWVTSAGNAPAISQAKDQMISAIIGLILALGANFILYSINPALTRLKSLNITPIEKIELMWNVNFPVGIKEWYWPGNEPYPGARKCGNKAMIKQDGNLVDVLYGTECEENKVCDLKFSLTEDDYLKWQKKEIDKPIGLLLTFEEGRCVGGNVGVIKLAAEDHSQLKTYKLDLLYTRCDSTSDLSGGVCFTRGTLGNYYSDSTKGCTYITLKQIYKDGKIAYFTKNFCNFYTPIGKSCPFDKSRASCDKCSNFSNSSNCTNTNYFNEATKKICCCDNINTGDGCQLY